MGTIGPSSLGINSIMSYGQAGAASPGDVAEQAQGLRAAAGMQAGVSGGAAVLASDEDDRAVVAMLMRQHNLSFSVDEDSGVSVVKIIDSESGDIIRQMPSEAWVRMARHINDYASGLLSEKA